MKNESVKTPEEGSLEWARQHFTVVDVHAPTLDDNLQPAFELLNVECPIQRDGKCHKCDKFAGFYTEEEAVFSFGKYEGFCDSKTSL